jgi:IS5 family transposase
MTIIPPFIFSAIQANLMPLLRWFSEEMYRRLLGREPQHFLVRLHQHLDCVPLEESCAEYHHRSGSGAPVVHGVPRLVRILLIKYLLNLSLREVESAIRWNLLVKWFVGYAVFDAGPDHATLERFEQWVCEHRQRTFFDEVLAQIDQAFPEERRKAQIADTYALRAHAAAEGLITLIRHSCQCLLAALGQVDDRLLTQVESELDQAALLGAADEAQEYRLDAAQRSQRLQQTVITAVRCQELIRALWSQETSALIGEQPTVTGWLNILDKILADEVSITRNEQGEIIQVQELPKKKKGTYRIGSATDPDATHRVHGERKDFGYNVSVAATDTFIREIRVDTGSQPDPVAIVDLLRAQQEHHGLKPPKLIYDKAAGAGKWHKEVSKVSGGQTQLVAPLMAYDERSERFNPDDFTLSPDGQQLTCPNKQVSEKAYRSQSGQGRSFRFSAQQCQDCPLADRCRGDKLPTSHMRQVFISDHRSVLALARTYAQTAGFIADLALRAVIERFIANLVRYHNGRDAQRRGKPNCDYQVKMNGVAFNLRQWMREIDKRSKASTAASLP